MRSVECRATVFLVAWHTGKESVKGTQLPRLINIVVVRREEDVGLLRKDRPPLRLGRLSESNAFSRREESSLIHGVRRRVRLVA